MQPGRGDVRDTSYPAVIGAGLGVPVENLGCSGETTVSLVHGGLCRYDEGSQLRAAEAILRRSPARLVTVDIGANDALWCAAPGHPDPQCLTKGLDQVRSTMPQILGRLRTAAGRDVPIVVLTYYNPYLAWERHGATEAELDRAKEVIDELNATLTRAAGAAGATVVDMGAALHGADVSPTTIAGERMPRNVAGICVGTFVCTKSDIHLTDEGARMIGEAVVAAVGTTP